jgi:hypothetical protein
MDIGTEQRHIEKIIHDHVMLYPDNDQGKEHLLLATYDYMEGFKSVMDTVSSVQMDYLCQQYSGFYRFAKLMELMAQGIADGVIEVPKDH